MNGKGRGGRRWGTGEPTRADLRRQRSETAAAEKRQGAVTPKDRADAEKQIFWSRVKALTDVAARDKKWEQVAQAIRAVGDSP